MNSSGAFRTGESITIAADLEEPGRLGGRWMLLEDGACSLFGLCFEAGEGDGASSLSAPGDCLRACLGACRLTAKATLPYVFCFAIVQVDRKNTRVMNVDCKN